MDFHANGKLMLFGEYFVLKGSKCIAIPLKYNQKAEITTNASNSHNWKSVELGKEWFSAKFDKELHIIESEDSEKAEIIQGLLKIIFSKKPSLFHEGLDFIIQSNFPKEWGLGSSSSLISLLSQWSNINAYGLLAESFGGSGYDIACATATKTILYEAKDRSVQEIDLKKEITSKLLFVYSGNKQSSKEEINRFHHLEIPNIAIEEMNEIIFRVLNSECIDDFEDCMDESEHLLERSIRSKKIKSKLFQDYPFSIKSLGAWGGDFFMASFRNEEQAKNYFNDKGFTTHFTYSELTYH